MDLEKLTDTAHTDYIEWQGNLRIALAEAARAPVVKPEACPGYDECTQMHEALRLQEEEMVEQLVDAMGRPEPRDLYKEGGFIQADERTAWLIRNEAHEPVPGVARAYFVTLLTRNGRPMLSGNPLKVAIHVVQPHPYLSIRENVYYFKGDHEGKVSVTETAQVKQVPAQEMVVRDFDVIEREVAAKLRQEALPVAIKAWLERPGIQLPNAHPPQLVGQKLAERLGVEPHGPLVNFFQHAYGSSARELIGLLQQVFIADNRGIQDIAAVIDTLPKSEYPSDNIEQMMLWITEHAASIQRAITEETNASLKANFAHECTQSLHKERAKVESFKGLAHSMTHDAHLVSAEDEPAYRSGIRD